MRISTKLVALGVGLALAAGATTAQDWPQRPVKLVVGFPAGTSTDIVTRVYAEKLTEHFKQPFIVENKPGASGAVAAAATASAPADGYALYVVTIANAIGQSVFKNYKVDVASDFSPIALFAATPTVLVASPKLPVTSLAELTQYAKTRPGELFYASGGAGTAPHVVGELYNQKAGTKLVHVPYKSLGEGVRDLMTGRVSVMFAPLPAVAPFIQSGQLKPLAISTGTRSPLSPATPTFTELGYPQFEAEIWSGLIAPKNTPATIVNAISEMLNNASNDPETRKRLAGTGAVPMPSSPQAFSSFLRAEVGKWKTVVDTADIKID